VSSGQKYSGEPNAGLRKMNFRQMRIEFFQFHPETGKEEKEILNNPFNPVPKKQKYK
jgi:hypothetical protein